MLYSIQKETGHETPKDKSTNKKNYEIIPSPLSPHPHPDINQPPPPPPPPILSPHHLLFLVFIKIASIFK